MKFEVYVASLEAYNAGELKGKFIYLPMDEEELANELKELGEEVAIHDHEFDLDIKIDEYTSISKLNMLTKTIEELEEYEQTKLLAICESEYTTVEDLLNSNLEEFIENFDLYEDVMCDKDYGYYLVDEGLMGDIPDNLKYYIDYEALGRDCNINESGNYTSYGYVVRRD